MADGATTAASIIALAHQYVGQAYVSGGTAPGGFDCSGLVQYVYGKNGIALPRVTFDQVNQGVQVDSSKAAPGDLVFFDETGADAAGPGGSPWGHVGIYLGNGMMLNAENPQAGVTITPVAGFSPVGKYQFRRVISNYAGTGDTGMANGAGLSTALASDVSSSTAPSAQWDSSSVAASLGLSQSLFDSNPELKRVMAQAQAEGLQPDSAIGRARFTALLQGTSWYRDKTDQQRKWELLGQADPAEARQQFVSSLGNVIHTAASLGISLSKNDEWTLASQNAQFGWTADELKYGIAAHFQTNKTGTYGGQAGQIADDIHQKAADYGYPVSAATVGYATSQILNGKATPEDVLTNMKNYAMGLFPGAKDALMAGRTLKDIAQPYLALNQSILEQAPDQVNLATDTNLRKALGYVAPAEPGAKPPAAGAAAQPPTMQPLWQYEQTLKNDPRWLGTDNAQQSIVGAGVGVLKDMGLSA